MGGGGRREPTERGAKALGLRANEETWFNAHGHPGTQQSLVPRPAVPGRLFTSAPSKPEPAATSRSPEASGVHPVHTSSSHCGAAEAPSGRPAVPESRAAGPTHQPSGAQVRDTSLIRAQEAAPRNSLMLAMVTWDEPCPPQRGLEDRRLVCPAPLGRRLSSGEGAAVPTGPASLPPAPHCS